MKAGHSRSFYKNKMPHRASIFLITYNQEKYVEDAVLSAINQDCESLEIVISDDCSTDSTFDIIRRVAAEYRGKHAIRLNKNPKNLGLVAHANLAPKLCQGNIIIFQAGDDVSLRSRAGRVIQAFSQEASIDGVFTAATVISESGKVIKVNDAGTLVRKRNPPEFYARGWNGHLGATQAYSRWVYEAFGPLDESAPWEDALLGFRASLGDGMVALPEPLILYRQHTQNLTDIVSLKDSRALVHRYKARIPGWLKITRAMRGDLETAYRMRIIDAAKHAALVGLLEQATARAELEMELSGLSRSAVFKRLLDKSVIKSFRMRSLIRMFMLFGFPPVFYGAFLRGMERRNSRLGKNLVIKEKSVSA